MPGVYPDISEPFNWRVSGNSTEVRNDTQVMTEYKGMHRRKPNSFSVNVAIVINALVLLRSEIPREASRRCVAGWRESPHQGRDEGRVAGTRLAMAEGVGLVRERERQADGASWELDELSEFVGGDFGLAGAHPSLAAPSGRSRCSRPSQSGQRARETGGGIIVIREGKGLQELHGFRG